MNDLIGGQQAAGDTVPPGNETKNYADGSSAMGPGPLPNKSPDGALAIDPPAVPVGTEPKGDSSAEAFGSGSELGPPDYRASYDQALLDLAQERAEHDQAKADLTSAIEKLKNAAEMGFTGANIHRGA